MRASDVPNTVWTREGRVIVEANAKLIRGLLNSP
jgi:hypothetical protein